MDKFGDVKNLYLIAAGTGITPIRSLIRSLSNGTSIHLFYGAQESKQLLYLDEFKELNAKVNLTIDNMEKGWEYDDRIIVNSKIMICKVSNFYLSAVHAKAFIT